MTSKIERTLGPHLHHFGFPVLFLSLAIFFASSQTVFAQATWSPIVQVGPGYVDCYTRQVVRTSGNVVYVVTNASGFSGGTALSSVRMYKGSPAGNPTSFIEVDAAHRPSNSVRFGGVEAKLAGADRFVQVVYEDIQAAQTKYVKFDTLTDTWGAPEVVGGLNGQNTLDRYMGKTGLALDANGLPHVITGGTNESMYYTDRTAGSWSPPVVVASSSAQMHPSLAFDHGGTLHLAFYGGTATMLYRQRSASGVWSAAEIVTGSASASQADESPSLAIDSAGRPLVNYIAGDFSFHYKLALRTAANTWTDISPTAAIAGHGPGLYIDSADNIFALEGHDLTIIQPSVEVRSASGVWGPYSILASGPPTRDGSASARWDLLWPGSTGDLDTVNMDEAGVDPVSGSVAISYYLHASLNAPPPPPPGADFSLSLPSGSTVSITAGQSATSNLSIASTGGFKQQVTLSCSGAPAGTTCTVTPSSVNPNGGTATSQISITSTARSSNFQFPLILGIRWCLLALFATLLWKTKTQTRWSGRSVRIAWPGLTIALVIAMVGCGSGSSASGTGAAPGPTPTPTTGGTPAGTFVLTVTGTAGSSSRSTILTLVVK